MVFNYNIQCPIMNYVCIYSILTTKNSLNTCFIFFCLLYSPACVTLIRLQQWSTKIFKLHFPMHLFSIWEISWWKFLPCSSETAPMFAGKNPNGNVGNEVLMTCYTPSTVWWDQLLEHFNVLVCSFHCLESFCRCSQMPSMLFFLQHLILY